MFKWIRSKIGAKLLIIFSLVLVLSMGSLIFIATKQVTEFGEFCASRNEINIRDKANAFLARITHEQAMRYESTFKKFADSSALLAKQAAFLLENMPLYGKTPFKPNEKLVIYPHNGIFSNDRSERTMVLYWGSPTMSPGISEQINALSHLDPLLETVKESNPESVACYAVTEPGIARYYPNIHGVEKLPPTTKFDVRNATWYVIAKPENNLERKTVWSNIYLDSVGQGLLTTASTPVYSKSGKYLGAAGVDVTLDTIVNDILEHKPLCHKVEGMFSFLVDNQGKIIAFPPEYLDMFEIKIDQDKLVDATVILKLSLLDSSNMEIRKIGQSMLEKKYQVAQFVLNGHPYIISSHFMPSTGWGLGVVVPESILLASVQETRNALDSTVTSMTTRFILVTILFLIVSIIVIAILSIKYFIRPLGKLSKGALRVEEGDLNTHVDIYSKDEIGSLSQSFNNMVDTLRKGKESEKAYTEKLEQNVNERTSELRIKNEELKKTLQELEQEISERTRAERALGESEEKFRLLAEQSLLGIIIIQDGLVKYVNEAASGITEYSIEEALDWKPNVFGKLFHPDDLEFVMEQAQKKQEGAEDVVTHYSYRMLTKSGKVKWVDQYSKTITFGRKTADLITIIDITERRRIEEEFSKIEKLESLGILAGGLAHDFNNILTIIMGNISLAKMDADRGSNIYESLEEAEKASQRATNLTQQLLTFAKGGTPVKETASLAEVVRESTSFALRGSKVRADFVIPEGLWAAEIDVGQMNQVISNLVINADQAMPEGGVIRIQAENIFIEPRHVLPVPPGKYVKISIKDEGIGIAGSHLQKIFDPYFSTKQKGSGLGLATVHSIVNKHDGHIAADSEVGVGTTFDIYLPASKKELAETKEVEKEVIKGQGKVLVMDDEESIRSLARQSLHRLGYEIELAADGDEAIEKYEKAKLSQNPYDAVILDLTIPGGLGGKECIQKLREIDPEVKAIVASGYADDPVMANFGDYGFTLAVTKPFSVEKLGQALHNVLTGSYKK